MMWKIKIDKKKKMDELSNESMYCSNRGINITCREIE